MAWRWPGDKPLSELMMVRLPTHICITQAQWVYGCMCHTIGLMWQYSDSGGCMVVTDGLAQIWHQDICKHHNDIANTFLLIWIIILIKFHHILCPTIQVGFFFTDFQLPVFWSASVSDQQISTNIYLVTILYCSTYPTATAAWCYVEFCKVVLWTIHNLHEGIYKNI